VYAGRSARAARDAFMRLYPKIGHLPGSRTGPSDRHVPTALAERLTARARPGDRVVVEEKLDGSCVLVARVGGALVALGREGGRCADSRNEGRRRFAAWVAGRAATFAWLGEGERLAGEWLALTHGTRYALPHGPFVAFDLFDAGGRRAGRSALASRLPAALPRPYVVHEGGPITPDAALAALGVRGRHGALDAAEGVVYRLESADRAVAVAKYVRAGKVDGAYLADHTGLGHVWNAWSGDDDGPRSLRRAGARWAAAKGHGRAGRRGDERRRARAGRATSGGKCAGGPGGERRQARGRAGRRAG
jgi:hypothetical protein